MASLPRTGSARATTRKLNKHQSVARLYRMSMAMRAAQQGNADDVEGGGDGGSELPRARKKRRGGGRASSRRSRRHHHHRHRRHRERGGHRSPTILEDVDEGDVEGDDAEDSGDVMPAPRRTSITQLIAAEADARARGARVSATVSEKGRVAALDAAYGDAHFWESTTAQRRAAAARRRAMARLRMVRAFQPER